MLNSLNMFSSKQLCIVALVLVIVIDQSLASNQQWANMNIGLWGKRSGRTKPLIPRDANYLPMMESADNFMDKRAVQWQAANGLWGKRSDPGMQRPLYYPETLQYLPQQA